MVFIIINAENSFCYMETVILFQDSLMSRKFNEQHLFKTGSFCYNKNVFPVDQLNGVFSIVFFLFIIIIFFFILI